MKQSSLPDYPILADVLSETMLKPHPSQVHGLICGILSGDPDHAGQWIELTIGKQASNTASLLLQTLYDVSKEQLDEFLFELQLILPDDTEELSTRAEALTLWCQGFLTGLKLAKVDIIDREPSEMTEAIHDLVEIAKLQYEYVTANEEDEVAYTELVEFVRVAVILIYQDSHEESAAVEHYSSHLH